MILFFILSMLSVSAETVQDRIKTIENSLAEKEKTIQDLDEEIFSLVQELNTLYARNETSQGEETLQTFVETEELPESTPKETETPEAKAIEENNAKTSNANAHDAS